MINKHRQKTELAEETAMKIIKALKLEKYDSKERYTQVDGFVYRDAASGSMGISDSAVYCVTLYCELEENEDTQYPLEDILDKYNVNCTDVMEEKEENGRRIYIVELEGTEPESIREIAGLVGKRVFNYEEGDCIKLGIESQLSITEV